MATVEPSPSTQTIGTNGLASSDNNPENVHEKVARMASLKQHSPLFLFFEEPHSGPLAQHFANIMTIVVIVSIIAFCLETENVRLVFVFLFVCFSSILVPVYSF